MPLFEYRCRGCARQFEALVRKHDVPACPACMATDVEQLPSLFAVNTPGTRAAARESSMPKSRSTHIEKEIGEREDYERHRH